MHSTMKIFSFCFLFLITVPMLLATENNLNDSLKNYEFPRSYKVWVKLQDGSRRIGFLYALHENAIIVADRDPRKLDSAGLKNLKLTTIYDTCISKINVRRKNQVPNAVLGLAAGSLVIGTMAYVTGKDDPGSFLAPTRFDQALLAAYLVGSFLVIPVTVVSAIPRVFRINGNRAAFHHALSRLRHKTYFEIHPALS